jgi:hypothetical protein
MPDSEVLNDIRIIAFGNDGLLVDSWLLYRKGKFARSWWSNNGGAICLSGSHDDPCWPGISGAEFAVKGVKLYMSSDEWEKILYDSAEPSISPSISLQPSVSAHPSAVFPDIGYPGGGLSRIYVKIENYVGLTDAELLASAVYWTKRGYQTYLFPLGGGPNTVLGQYPLTGTPSGFYLDWPQPIPRDICMDWYFVTPNNDIKLTVIIRSAPGLGPNLAFQTTGPCTGTNNYCGPWVNSGVACPPLANPFMPSDVTGYTSYGYPH